MRRLLLVPVLTLLGALVWVFWAPLMGGPQEPHVREQVEPAPAFELVFHGLPAATTAEEQLSIRVADTMTLQGEQVPVPFHWLLRDGERYGEGIFGQILNARGEPLLVDGEPFECNAADYNGLLEHDGELWAVSHLECIPAAIYLTRLSSDEGVLSPVETVALDTSEQGGLINPCAGDPTPWGTHLASEEYEFDARRITLQGTLDPDLWGYGRMADYLGVPVSEVHVYRYGWIPEVSLTDQGPSMVRHYAMGRFSHELALVMPDQRTVYLADDGANVGFFVFVADEAGDLSAGHLYAARLDQTAAVAGGSFDVTWIPLGHATDAEIAPWVEHKNTRLGEVMSVADPVDSRCRPRHRRINTSTGHECVAVQPGMETVASRLETRRYAALSGATTELRKGEGLAFDPDRRRLYYAISEISGGMTEKHPVYDVGHKDRIRLEENVCGAIYGLDLGSRLEDASGEVIDSDWLAVNAEAVIRGRPTGSETSDACDPEAIANPDNITYVPGAHLLVVAEDTPRHRNAVLWGIDLRTGEHTRLLSAPRATELSGAKWFDDVGGHAYLTVTLQRPWDPEVLPEDLELPAEADERTVTGYFGPFPPPSERGGRRPRPARRQGP